MDQRWVLLLLSAVCLAGCVSPRPYEDWVLADFALRAASEAGARNLAPAQWIEAERNMSVAVQAIKDRDNDLARKSFQNARRRAEVSENISRTKRSETGEVPL